MYATFIQTFIHIYIYTYIYIYVHIYIYTHTLFHGLNQPTGDTNGKWWLPKFLCVFPAQKWAWSLWGSRVFSRRVAGWNDMDIFAWFFSMVFSTCPSLCLDDRFPTRYPLVEVFLQNFQPHSCFSTLLNMPLKSALNTKNKTYSPCSSLWPLGNILFKVLYRIAIPTESISKRCIYNGWYFPVKFRIQNPVKLTRWSFWYKSLRSITKKTPSLIFDWVLDTNNFSEFFSSCPKTRQKQLFAAVFENRCS